VGGRTKTTLKKSKEDVGLASVPKRSRGIRQRQRGHGVRSDVKGKKRLKDQRRRPQFRKERSGRRRGGVRWSKNHIRYRNPEEDLWEGGKRTKKIKERKVRTSAKKGLPPPRKCRKLSLHHKRNRLSSGEDKPIRKVPINVEARKKEGAACPAIQTNHVENVNEG